MTTSPRLAQLARPSPSDKVLQGAEREEQCELCAEPIAAEHRHLLDLESRRLLCACRACSILFDRAGAGGRHYRLVPDRARFVTDFDLDDLRWGRFGIPVGMAFFFQSTPAGRVVAFYPSPLGATESLLDLDAWSELVTANPILEDVEPDVEALLVDRTNGKRLAWLLPVDRCYELVGLVRTHWKGFAGGAEVWAELEAYFAGLAERARPVTRDGKEARWDSRSESPT
jgi:Family of unknown function (DUF5947)